MNPKFITAIIENIKAATNPTEAHPNKDIELFETVCIILVFISVLVICLAIYFSEYSSI